MKIYYNTSGQYRVDESGTKTITNKPMLRYKEQPVWELHFVDNENSPVNLSGDCRVARGAGQGQVQQHRTDVPHP